MVIIMKTKEIDLLQRVKMLLECVDTAPLQDQAYLIIREIEELLTQPEEEPIEDEELKNLYDRHEFAMESDEYMWGFRDAEKAHGIGGEE